MLLREKTCVDFCCQLSSKEPVPGGGGVAALAGALGTALGEMVCSLTRGKKKYAEFEADIQRISSEAEKIRTRLLALIDEDAENFYPLSQAYGMPRETEEDKLHREKTLQECFRVALQGPAEIMRVTYQAALLQRELVEKGSALAISDVGCGVLLLKGAMQSAWLNVLVNLNCVKDQDYIQSVRSELIPMMDECCRICDEVYEIVLKKIGA